MRTSVLLDTLQNLIGFKPKAKDFVKILNFSSEKTFYTRVQRDSEFSDEEIAQIEYFYAINIRGGNNNCIELDFYPNVFGGNDFDETFKKISIAKEVIDNYSVNNHYYIISAVGSSMSPTINNCDRLIIQEYNNEQICDNVIYLFKCNNEIFVKRLVKNINQIICISDNNKIEDVIIDPDNCNFKILGRVIGLYRSNF